MTEHKHAAVLRAIAEHGETAAEYRVKTDDGEAWITSDRFTNPINNPNYDWRIKPRTPRRIWVNEYEDGGWSYHTAKESAERCTHRCVARFEFIEVLPDE